MRHRRSPPCGTAPHAGFCIRPIPCEGLRTEGNAPDGSGFPLRTRRDNHRADRTIGGHGEESQQPALSRLPLKSSQPGHQNRQGTVHKLPLFSYPAEPPNRASSAPHQAHLRQESASTPQKHPQRRLPEKMQLMPRRQSGRKALRGRGRYTEQTNRRTP